MEISKAISKSKMHWVLIIFKRTAQYLFHKTIKNTELLLSPCWTSYIEKGLSMLRLLTLCIQKIKETL